MKSEQIFEAGEKGIEAKALSSDEAQKKIEKAQAFAEAEFEKKIEQWAEKAGKGMDPGNKEALINMAKSHRQYLLTKRIEQANVEAREDLEEWLEDYLVANGLN